MKKTANVIRGKLRSPFLDRKAPGEAEAREGEGGFRNKAIHGRTHRSEARTHGKG